MKVRIKKYNFYLGRTQTLTRNISKKKYKELKNFTKYRPEFKNAFKIKIIR